MNNTSIQFITAWLQARYTNSDQGATMVEYALMVALVALVAAVGAQLLGGGLSTVFSKIGSKVGSTPVT